ncbi:MAG: hypothetical protein ACUVT5_07495 [Candidatus Bathyarchaeales archaeon]
MRTKRVESGFKRHGLLSGLLRGRFGSSEMIKPVMRQIRDEVKVEQVKAIRAFDLLHLTLG